MRWNVLFDVMAGHWNPQVWYRRILVNDIWCGRFGCSKAKCSNYVVQKGPNFAHMSTPVSFTEFDINLGDTIWPIGHCKALVIWNKKSSWENFYKKATKKVYSGQNGYKKTAIISHVLWRLSQSHSCAKKLTLITPYLQIGEELPKKMRRPKLFLFGSTTFLFLGKIC